MKLEVQTHCRIALLIEPTWECGKAFRYISGKKDIFREKARNLTETDVFIANTLETMKNCEPKQEEPEELEDVTTTVEPMCWMCCGGKDTSAWISCSFKENGKDVCEFRVHQMCIGLKYSDETKLKGVPFFCPTHMLAASNEVTC